MENLSPHRTFVDPGNTKGLPEVRRHTPVPHRDEALPGTKRLECPPDDHLKEMIRSHSPTDSEPSRAGLLAGRAAFGVAVFGVSVLLAFPWLERLGIGDGVLTLLIFLCGAAVHVLAAVSLMLTDWRSQAGGWALFVVYVGGFAKMVLGFVLDDFGAG